MKEQLYTIPVNDAFSKDCECPLCQMYNDLEKESIDFMLGPSYMEDDIRMETNKTGFCSKHVKQLYKGQNRLGIALMLHTHMQNTNEMIRNMSSGTPAKKGLFSKRETPELSGYIQSLEESCYVCNRMENVFRRYLVTVIHCYTHDSEFKDKFLTSKGFCTKHYGMLYDEATNSMSGSKQKEFIDDLNRIYIENMQRVTDDLEWFIDKFDYRNEDAPWKNSRDAIQRSIQKVNSINVEE